MCLTYVVLISLTWSGWNDGSIWLVVNLNWLTGAVQWLQNSLPGFQILHQFCCWPVSACIIVTVVGFLWGGAFRLIVCGVCCFLLHVFLDYKKHKHWVWPCFFHFFDIMAMGHTLQLNNNMQKKSLFCIDFIHAHTEGFFCIVTTCHLHAGLRWRGLHCNSVGRFQLALTAGDCNIVGRFQLGLTAAL